ncbi:MAG: hypothetical protein ACKO69_05335, partial [Limnohabitans sp.]
LDLKTVETNSVANHQHSGCFFSNSCPAPLCSSQAVHGGLAICNKHLSAIFEHHSMLVIQAKFDFEMDSI